MARCCSGTVAAIIRLGWAAVNGCGAPRESNDQHCATGVTYVETLSTARGSGNPVASE